MKLINILLVLSSLKAVPAVSQQIFEHHTILDHNNRVLLDWDIINTTLITAKLTIILTSNQRLSSQDSTVIGLGFSDHGQFTNADFAIFQITNQKQAFIYDALTDSQGILQRYPTSDYSLNQFSIQPLKIQLFFTRTLCANPDRPNAYTIESGTTHIIHFISLNKQIYDAFNFRFQPDKHADSHDMKQSQLIKPRLSKTSLNPQTTMNFEARVNRIKLPNADTTYWCHVHKLESKFDHKHHITAFESVITESSKGIVHHMELFHCITDPTDNMKLYSGPCNSEAKPEGLTQCRKVVAAWAMGAGIFIYPDNVGGVIGGPNYSSYLVLEIHFDNPNHRANIIDSSGIRVYYQSKLRKYDAGIMEIGLEYNPKNSIPPQNEAFHLHGFCLSECTKVGLPSEGITIFASQLHTHLAGRRVWTSLVRNERVIEIINSDNHYDQMFQEIRMLPRPVKVLPGDALINTCVYDTRSRQNMTFGGYSIRDEMCVNYMHYWPLAELEVCKSSISDQVLDDFFSKMNYYDNSPTSLKNSIQKNFNLIRWTPLTSSILSNLYDISPISFSCNSSAGTHIEGAYTGKEYPEYFESIQPKNLKKLRAPEPDCSIID